MAYRPDWVSLIQSTAARLGIDPRAALAVASREGLSGGVGDGGHAFGPFQLNDAGGVITGRPGNHQAFAESPAGIQWALQQIAQVARGLKGPAAVSAIVNQFERPADKPAEIAGALANYGKIGAGAAPSPPQPAPFGGAPTAPGASPVPASNPAVGSALMRFSQTGDFMPFFQALAASRRQPVAGKASPYTPLVAGAPSAPSAPSAAGVPSAGASPAFSGPSQVAVHGSQHPTRLIIHDTEDPGSTPASLVQGWKGNGYGSQWTVTADGKLVQLAPDTALTYHTGGANTGSVGIEQAGKASWTRQEWMAHPKELQATAQWLARESARWGIPLTLNATRGVSTHATQSALHPESQGHSDPGPGYPLDYVLGLARQIGKQQK